MAGIHSSGRSGDADGAAINPSGEWSGPIDIFDSRSHVEREDSATGGEVDAVADAQSQELAESEIDQFLGCRNGSSCEAGMVVRARPETLLTESPRRKP